MNLQNSMDDETLLSARDGGIAGLIATAPMTVAMEAIHRQLPLWERAKPLPPEQITLALADQVDADDGLNRRGRQLLTLASHFGYGATSGAAYGVFAQRTQLPPVLSGAGFGLAIWAASYLGWLPVAGVRRSAAKEPAGTNLMMIASHLVWGVTTSLAYESLRRRR